MTSRGREARPGDACGMGEEEDGEKKVEKADARGPSVRDFNPHL